MARKRDQETRRQQLIDAARAAVAEKGLAAVQLRDVAKAADLTPGAVLYYYDDLHDLLQQVYEGATRRYSIDREAGDRPALVAVAAARHGAADVGAQPARTTPSCGCCSSSTR